MNITQTPQAYWDIFDKETSAIATQLERQLRKQRHQRRGFGGMIAKFDRLIAVLRNDVRAMEMRNNRLLKEKKAGKGKASDGPFLRLLRRRLNVMRQVAEAMKHIQQGKARPLYAPRPSKFDITGVQVDALDTTMFWLHRVMSPNPQSEEAKEMGGFSDIPLSSQLFMAHAHAAFRVALAQKRPEPLRFVDVGCGGGMKVLLAAEFFDQSDGFDFDPVYVEAAQSALSNIDLPRCNTFSGDALKFDDYAKYDVIYFYQPMSDRVLIAEMEARIANTARPGTILIAPYFDFMLRAPGLNCGCVAQSVFVTATSQAEADKLRAAAERIGPQVLRPGQVLGCQGVNWLRSLVRACAVNGYVVEL